MASGFPSFEKLISPCSLENFFAEYWEQKPLVAGGENYQLRFNLADIDAYLERSDLRVPALRLVQDGKNIPTRSFVKELTFGAHKSTDLIDTDKVIRLFQKGATILIQLAHISFPTLKNWCAELELFWGFPIEMNVYLTPPNSQGFSLHYDTHSVFALQISGSKIWQLYENSVTLPLLDEPFSESGEGSSQQRLVTQEIELQEGQFLYIPRGHFHSAKANTEASLHITVGFFPPTRLNIIKRWVETLRTDKFFRSAPSSYLKPIRSKSSIDKEQIEIQDMLKHCARMDLANLVDQKSSSIEIQPKSRRLLDSLALNAICRTTQLLVRENLSIAISENSSVFEIVVFDTKISFPLHSKEAIYSALSKSGVFCAVDLESNYSDESKIVLCKRLVKEGVLTLV